MHARDVIILMEAKTVTWRIKKNVVKKLVSIFLFFIIAQGSYAQSIDDEIHFFKLTSYTGEVRLKAFYRDQRTLTAGVEDHKVSSLYSAGVLLRGSSYFWTKKFFVLDFEGEFNPEHTSDSYIVVPDQAEVRTVSRIGLSGTFFQQKHVSLNLFAHMDQSYSNRENLTNLKSHSKDYGGILNFANKILPANVGYKESWSTETEIGMGRTFDVHQQNFMGIANKTFGKRDRNEFTYSHDIYESQQYDQPVNNVTTDNMMLTNTFFFDKKQDYRFNSYINNFRQKRFETLKRFQASETFTARLPGNLNLYTNYTYFQWEQVDQKSKLNNINARLSHQLFESLNTTVFGEYNDTKNTYYHETREQAGISFLYQKKLPTKGLLTLGYKYELQDHKQISDPVQLKIINEHHVLTDGKIELLDKAYVTLSSIVVKDATGSIIYQINFDYTIVQIDNFVQILRLPGGQIANNGTVLVDYIAIQPGSYSFDQHTNNVVANVMLFDKLIELYYRYTNQDFTNLEQTEYLSVEYITENLYGLKLEYKAASVGVEYDNYESNIIPYKLMRYFLVVQGNFKGKAQYSLAGNIRNYDYVAENITQEYDDVVGSLSFPVSQNSILSFNASYRYQKGTGIDLKLFTERTEFTTNYRRIYITLAVDLYKRLYIGEKLNFYGGSVQISRRF